MCSQITCCKYHYMDIKKTIEGMSIDTDNIKDPVLRSIFTQLLGLIESQAAKIKGLEEENQQLRDENNRLKGEQGKPNIRKQTNGNQNFSSEKERKRKSNKKKPRLKKKSKISI